jgi:hypothetical protein
MTLPNLLARKGMGLEKIGVFGGFAMTDRVLLETVGDRRDRAGSVPAGSRGHARPEPARPARAQRAKADSWPRVRQMSPVGPGQEIRRIRVRSSRVDV